MPDSISADEEAARRVFMGIRMLPMDRAWYLFQDVIRTAIKQAVEEYKREREKE